MYLPLLSMAIVAGGTGKPTAPARLEQTITRDTYQHVQQVQNRDAAEKVVALLAPKDAAKKAGS
jgi:adenine/guanine phosphoribosyltransferase-like PRPP-binding protein